MFEKVNKILSSEDMTLEDYVAMLDGEPETFFVGADFSGIDIRGMDLTKFNFHGASFRGAIFDSQTNVKEEFKDLLSAAEFVEFDQNSSYYKELFLGTKITTHGSVDVCPIASCFDVKGKVFVLMNFYDDDSYEFSNPNLFGKFMISYSDDKGFFFKEDKSITYSDNAKIASEFGYYICSLDNNVKCNNIIKINGELKKIKLYNKTKLEGNSKLLVAYDNEDDISYGEIPCDEYNINLEADGNYQKEVELVFDFSKDFRIMDGNLIIIEHSREFSLIGYAVYPVHSTTDSESVVIFPLNKIVKHLNLSLI